MFYFRKALAITIFVAANFSAQAAENKTMQMLPRGVVTPAIQYSDGKKPIALSALKGQYVLVNFWATWCSPCVQEMPALDRLAGRLEKNGAVVVAISQDEGGPLQVRPFVEKLKLTKLRILYDQDKKSFREYALRGLPTTVLISPEGKLIARLEGAAAWDEGKLAEQLINLTKVSK